MTGSGGKSILALAAALTMIGCAQAGHEMGQGVLPQGARYVAMGSSFAAGPGVTSPVGDAPARCGRSTDNYARLLARKRGFTLVDASCSGAATAHVLAPWGELPAQIEAVTADTRLVTITIGGNDLGYVGGLMGASCAHLASQSPEAAANPLCRASPAAAPDAFEVTEAGMREIVAQVRKRAPGARLIFVDYLTILPPEGTCALTPLSAAQADTGRAVAQRLAALTAKVATESGAGLVQASRLSAGHHACAGDPWMNGYVPDGRTVPYHPNLAGMTAIADALDSLLGR